MVGAEVHRQQDQDLRALYAFDLTKLQARDVIARDVTPRCGSVAESGSDDDVDDEVINVTDDDEEVTMATTEQSPQVNMQFKVSFV